MGTASERMNTRFERFHLDANSDASSGGEMKRLDSDACSPRAGLSRRTDRCTLTQITVHAAGDSIKCTKTESGVDAAAQWRARARRVHAAFLDARITFDGEYVERGASIPSLLKS